jgi:hypothetical protein
MTPEHVPRSARRTRPRFRGRPPRVVMRLDFRPLCCGLIDRAWGHCVYPSPPDNAAILAQCLPYALTDMPVDQHVQVTVRWRKLYATGKGTPSTHRGDRRAFPALHA